MNWWLKSLSVGFFVIFTFITNTQDVQAHRSGCHRWHSCPSDSGSYTCGDLGYPCIYSSTPTYYYVPPVVTPPPDPVTTDYTDPTTPNGYIIYNNSQTQKASSDLIFYNYKAPKVVWFGAKDDVKISHFYYSVSRNTYSDGDWYYSTSNVWEVPPEYFVERGEYYIFVKVVDANDNESEIVYATYRYDPDGLLLTDYDDRLITRFSGRFLKSSNTNGGLWYVSPKSKKKFFVGSAEELSTLIKRIPSNISDQNFNLLRRDPKDPNTLANYKGKFIRQANGKVWYINPVNNKLYRIFNSREGFKLFKNLSLGVTPTILEKMRSGSVQ